MATLQSPGVSVQVIDESFYTPSAPGTVPLIFVASAANKTNASGTGIAPGTLATNAGKVWTITSQRDLIDTFGTPVFYTDANNNPVHGGELNEYGLQAAYSLLGVSSKAYIVRADIDTSQLNPASDIPNGLPAGGTYWIDTNDSLYGVNEWDATNKVFVEKTVANGGLLVIDNDNKESVAALTGSVWTPKASFGTKGVYALVVTSENTNQLWFKNTDNVWVVVGSNTEANFSTSGFTSSCWQTSWPVAKSTGLGNVATGDVFKLNGTVITLGSVATAEDIAGTINAAAITGVGARVVGGKLALFADATAVSAGSTPDGKILLENTDNTPPGEPVLMSIATTVESLGFVSGTYGAVSLAIQPHTQFPQYASGKNPTGSIYVKTTSPGNGASWVVKYYSGTTQSWGSVAAQIYGSTESAIYNIDKAGGKNIPVGSLFIESNYDHGTGLPAAEKRAEFKVYRRAAVAHTTITVTPSVQTFANAATFQVKETLANSAAFSTAVTVHIPANATLEDVVAAVSGSDLVNVSAKYDAASGSFALVHALGGEFKLLDGTNSPLAQLGFTAYNMSTKQGTVNLYETGEFESDGFTLRASNWKPLVFEAKASAPYTEPADGQLWYSSIVDEIDIMYHNGTTWVGYKNAFPDTNPTGPMVSALAPVAQVDGTDLVDGDIWVSTADIERFGKDIYIWDAGLLKWIKQDPADQITPNGWLFADARWATSGQESKPASIVSLLTSNYLDPDAPDPSLYPQGVRLWNLRRCGFNVKKYVANYINIYANDGKNERYGNDPMDGSNQTVQYFEGRWITASPNAEDGVGSFGRFAQRGFVVAGLKKLIDVNQGVRDTDTLVFNLIATPGYPEAIQNMIALNTDRGLTALVIGDTPVRLKPTGTSLAEWGTNAALAYDNSDAGGVSYDEYMAMFYPSGYTNDNNGNYIVVPPSHMILRTIANSDAKSYPWFAPSGTRRGGVDNATSVGYVENGEFKTVALHEGLRDVMYQTAKINPIATFPGVGIVNYGNLTRARNASALDRINVARLVCHLRRQLDILSRPFLFEPNDRITRNEIKAAAESLLLELVGQRAIYDFIVVCDESNNTPSRIDRNELWMDIAIEPVKAVEFIYIPLRLKNTGDIKAGL